MYLDVLVLLTDYNFHPWHLSLEILAVLWFYEDSNDVCPECSGSRVWDTRAE